MFSLFQWGSPATKEGAVEQQAELPAPTVETTDVGRASYVPEAEEYAQFVLLQTKRHGGLPEHLIKVPKPAGGRGEDAPKRADGLSSEPDPLGSFDVITASAFDMVQVRDVNVPQPTGKKPRGRGSKRVPRYISRAQESSEHCIVSRVSPTQPTAGGCRVPSDEDPWVIVGGTPSKAQARAC